MGQGLHRVLSLDLTAADPDGIAQTQNPAGAGALTLNGAYVSGGVATLPEPQKVALTTGADETAFSVLLTGTNRYGRTISETVQLGNNTVVYSTLDFKTVTSAVISGNSGNVTIGTNERASSEVHIVGWHGNRSHYVDFRKGAGITATFQGSYDNRAPAWAVEDDTTVIWEDIDLSDDDGVSNDKVEGYTMFRINQTAGNAASTATIVTPEGR